MEWIRIVFGEGKDLEWWQMSSRAVIAFFITLLLIRIAGIRTFGKKSAFDNVIIIMLGSILSRVVVGASPFIPTTVACLVFVLVHWLLARISVYSDLVGRLIKGEKASLYADGRKNEKNMKRSRISDKDLLEGLRLKINDERFEEVKEMFLERNGEISVVKKKDGRGK
ncbi:MAG TPA: YetF domain-containing protein [Puia sp.]|nr:YetF domain-containing protein [Puia sp.]